MITKKIKLAELKPKSTGFQLTKITEEYMEVIQAQNKCQINNTKVNQRHLREEVMDLIQAGYTYLKTLTNNVDEEIELHLEKIERYGESGRVTLANNRKKTKCIKCGKTITVDVDELGIPYQKLCKSCKASNKLIGSITRQSIGG